MTRAEVGQAAALLSACYTWLGRRERLLARQTEYLLAERASSETVGRESRSETYLVARDGAGLAGLVAVKANRITKLYVHPSRHGRGLGRQLAQAAEELIRAGGFSSVELGAFPSAVPFYTALGYRIVGVGESGGQLTGLRITLMEKRLARET